MTDDDADDDDADDDDAMLPDIDDDERMVCYYCPPGVYFWASDGHCSRCGRPPWGCERGEP